MSLRILDPSGATVGWLKSQLQGAVIHRVPDDEGPYDAVMLYGDLDNMADPGGRLAAAAQHVKRPGGKIYVSVLEGTAGGLSKRTAGRRRAWRSVDVADMLRRYGRLEEFGVDEDGYVSAAISPCSKGREIAVWTGYAIGPWDPMDITTRGLGGSETAAYRIAEQLAERGHVVTLYGHFRQEGALKDVILKDYRRFDPTTPRQAVIAFRNAEMFDQPVNADKTILWLEDVAGGEGINQQRAERIDYVCTVSEWHTNNVKETYPWLPEEKIVTSRNGIMRSYFDGEAPDREQRVLYTSSPDRGLDIVLECWPEILKRVPDAQLYHTYGPWYDIVASVSDATAAHRARCRELAEANPGTVNALSGLGQQDLAMLMRSSMVWCHPSYFSLGNMQFCETSCISAMEAQAAGCRVVCADWGALQNTVKTGRRIDGDPMGDEWRARFVDEIVRGLTDPGVQAIAQTEGPAEMADHGWEGVCAQLESLWDRSSAQLEDGLVLAETR